MLPGKVVLAFVRRLGPKWHLAADRPMAYASSTDRRFLAKLDAWLRCQGEVLLFIRYSHAGGSREFEFFSSAESLRERLQSLPPSACVIVFRQPQLHIRGVVNDGLIATCLSSIPDGSELLVAETTRCKAGKASWFHHGAGMSHNELREELECLRGHAVAARLYPPWLEESADVMSVVVPDEHGVVSTGIY